MIESATQYNYSFKRRIANTLREVGIYSKAKALYRQTLNRKYLHQRQSLIQFFSAFVQPDDIVFDVGTNLGDFTDAFLALSATVYGLEPNPFCIRELQSLYGSHSQFTLIPKAVGPTIGKSTMYLGSEDMHITSTLSSGWTEAARKLPGMNRAGWTETIEVEVTTLDQLIQAYGIPAFCKIDIEGFEYEALTGLSQPIPCLSVEYVPWRIEPTFQSIEYLANLGNYQFNITTRKTVEGIGEFRYANWMSDTEMIDRLDQEIRDTEVFGDLYAKLVR